MQTVSLWNQVSDCDGPSSFGEDFERVLVGPNSRLLRLPLEARSFQFHISWRKGTEKVFADALSHHPVDIPTQAQEFGESPALSCRTLRVCLTVSRDSVGASQPPLQSPPRRSSCRQGLPAACRVRPIWFSAVHAQCTSIPPRLLKRS